MNQHPNAQAVGGAGLVLQPTAGSGTLPRAPTVHVNLPRPFTGAGDDVIDFLSTFERIAYVYQWDDTQKAHYLPACLSGDAAAEWGRFPIADRRDYEAVVRHFRDKYAPERLRSIYCLELTRTPQGEDENVAEYQERVRRLGQRGFPNLPPDQRDQVLMEFFLNGLRTDLLAQTRLTRPKSFDEAVLAAKELETIQLITPKVTLSRLGIATEADRKDMKATPNYPMIGMMAEPLVGVAKPVVQSALTGATGSSNDALMQMVMSRLDQMELLIQQNVAAAQQGMVGQTGGQPQQIPQQPSGGFQQLQPQSVQCFRCYGYGHIARNCPNPYPQSQQQPSAGQQNEFPWRPQQGLSEGNDLMGYQGMTGYRACCGQRNGCDGCDPGRHKPLQPNRRRDRNRGLESEVQQVLRILRDLVSQGKNQSTPNGAVRGARPRTPERRYVNARNFGLVKNCNVEVGKMSKFLPNSSKTKESRPERNADSEIPQQMPVRIRKGYADKGCQTSETQPQSELLTDDQAQQILARRPRVKCDSNGSARPKGAQNTVRLPSFARTCGEQRKMPATRTSGNEFADQPWEEPNSEPNDEISKACSYVSEEGTESKHIMGTNVLPKFRDLAKLQQAWLFVTTIASLLSGNNALAQNLQPSKLANGRESALNQGGTEIELKSVAPIAVVPPSALNSQFDRIERGTGLQEQESELTSVSRNAVSQHRFPFLA